MSNFDIAVKTVFGNEGGLTDHPADPGGITNFGITLDVLREDGPFGDINGDGNIDGDDIRELTREQARGIYNRQWWMAYDYWQISNQWIATKVFDFAVNLGPKQAHIVTQRALCAVKKPVVVDGLLGPKTLAALNDIELIRSCFHATMRCEAAGVYRMIAAKKPKLKVFLAGWLKRAYQ